MKFKDLVKETTTTTGTGPFVRGGAVAGFRAFTPAYNVGDIAPYFARLGAQWESGEGTVTATTIERTRVIDGSNGASLVNFSAGTKELYVAAPADFMSGVAIGDLPAASSVPDTYILEVANPSTGESFKLTLGGLRSLLGGTAPPVGDTTAPILSSATGTASGANGASGSVSTNEANGTLYCLASTSNTATKTAIKGGVSQAISSTGVKNFSVTGLLASTLYYLHFVHVDAAGNESSVATSSSFTTQAAGSSTTVPGAPTIGTATAGDGYVDVAFTAPASSGGSAVIDYTATLSTGETATGTTSPIRVTASNGPARTATVAARNSVGTGPASAASNSVTPAPAVAYEIKGYTSNGVVNAVKDTVDASAVTVYSGRKGLLTTPFVNGNGYWSITPTPASTMSGWSDSPTVPPAVVTEADNAGASGAGGNSTFQNGLIAMSKPSAWNNQSRVWVPVGTDPAKKWYFWIKPIDGAAQCMNPNGMTVTGA